MKIFIIGAPNKPTLDPTTDFNQANFGYATQIGAVCRAMYERDHEVIHVGVCGSNIACTKNVEVISKESWDKTFVKNEVLYHIYKKEFDQNVREILLKEPPHSVIVCVNSKEYHSNALKGISQFVVETCIGYGLHEIWAPYKTFMSKSWMQEYYNYINKNQVGQFDCVIPPCFDINSFPYKDKKENYLAMICRLVPSKGFNIAIELASRLNIKLKIAGPGDPKPYLSNANVEYLGVLGPKERNEVMGNAKALLSPTLYSEPFGMVVIEANLCGTPVITTDFGAFRENVCDRVSGYRCRTFDDFCKAVDNVDNLCYSKCREWGENYSYDKIGKKYEDYFKILLNEDICIRATAQFNNKPL